MTTGPGVSVGPNEVLALVLELAALAILCWWGFASGATVATSIGLGIGTPVVAALLWAMFAAPRARYTLPRPGVVAVKVLVFGGAAAALLGLGHPILAAVFAVIVAVNLIVEQRRRTDA